MNYPELRAWLEAHGTGDDAVDAAQLCTATVPSAGPSYITPGEFAARFTAQEYAAAKASDDAQVQQLMFQLTVQYEPMNLASPTVQGGLAYMAALGLLTQQRAAEIGAVAPGPMVAPCQQIGCGLMMEMDEPSAALAVAYARTFGDTDGSD